MYHGRDMYHGHGTVLGAGMSTNFPKPTIVISKCIDSLGRLATAKTNGDTAYPQWGLSWSYDRYGNRLSQAILVGCTGNNTCPTNSLAFSASGGALTNRPDGYTFDACGDLLNDGTNTLTYDGNCQLVSSSGMLGSGTYTYDGNGMRIEKVSGGTTTISIFSGSRTIAEYDNGAAPGSPSREYIYALGQQAAEISGSSTYYFQTDHLSRRFVTDSAGATQDQLGQFPFGELWYETGPVTTPVKFTTYYRDSESNNDYALARNYIDRFGRFMSVDPSGNSVSHATNPQSWNLYLFGLNNPIMFRDPTGLDCVYLASAL